MAALNRSEIGFVEVVSSLTNCNPFVPERIELEKRALGEEFVGDRADWNRHVESAGEHPNVANLLKRAERIARLWRESLSAGQRTSAEELQLYEDLVLFLLYHRSRTGFEIQRPSRGR